MPIYEFTFTDTSTEQVLAPDVAAAKLHIEELITASKYVDNGYKGKALASATGRVVDKFKERSAQG